MFPFEKREYPRFVAQPVVVDEISNMMISNIIKYFIRFAYSLTEKVGTLFKTISKFLPVKVKKFSRLVYRREHSGAMSSLAYNPGDIIIDNCDAFVKALSAEFQDSRCNNCFAEKVDLKSCALCKIFKYCDKKCQKQDWRNGHKLECKSKCFQQYCHTGINVDDKIFLFRMYAMLKLNPDLATQQFALHNGTSKCFNDLMSHQESIAKDVAMGLQSEEMAKRVNAENPGSRVEAEYLLRLLGIAKTNAFGILNEPESCQIGRGVYIEPSFFDHSCKPTAYYLNKGAKLQIRAIGPISKGEQPYISYLTNHLNKVQRQKLLRERYNFECHCEKCESGSDSSIDYAQLNSLVMKMKMLEMNPFFGGEWKTIYAQHKEILKMFRQLYHEYDERITNQFNRALTIAMHLRVGKQKITELFEDTRHHLRTTNGEDRHCYKQFEADIAPFFA